MNYRSERRRTFHGECVYVGYLFYEKTKKDVTFSCGHGLSYTQFEVKDLNVRNTGDEIVSTIYVLNLSARDGADAVQVYVSQRNPSINRPVKELKAFDKVVLKVGQSKEVEIKFSKNYAVSFWDEDRDARIMEKDTNGVLVGNSSAFTPLKENFEVEETSCWKGI